MERDSWDPRYLESVSPTSNCLRRIRCDLAELYRDPLPGIYCIPDEVMTNKCHALIVGPLDTPYAGGFFNFVITFPASYPTDPPKVKLLTTGGGTVRFNPNLYANGKVCLSILGTWTGPSWSPVQTLGSVLLSIQSLMNEHPYHNEPGFEAPNIFESRKYDDCIRHETLRVAVCEMAGDTSTSRSMPEKLRSIVNSLFPAFVDCYEITCVENMAKDGRVIEDPFGENRGCFMYGSIMTRIKEIEQSLPQFEDLEDDD